VARPGSRHVTCPPPRSFPLDKRLAYALLAGPANLGARVSPSPLSFLSPVSPPPTTSPSRRGSLLLPTGVNGTDTWSARSSLPQRPLPSAPAPTETHRASSPTARGRSPRQGVAALAFVINPGAARALIDLKPLALSTPPRRHQSDRRPAVPRSPPLSDFNRRRPAFSVTTSSEKRPLPTKPNATPTADDAAGPRSPPAQPWV